MRRTTVSVASLLAILSAPGGLAFQPISETGSQLSISSAGCAQSPLHLQAPSRLASRTCLHSSILGDDDKDVETTDEPINGLSTSEYQEQETRKEVKKDSSPLQSLVDGLPFVELFRGREKLPPMHVDDTSLLLYDVFLIVNLALSISFWVTHRTDFAFLPYAFSEGCLLSIFWVLSGLYHGMFLYSAVDGHYGYDDERGGPKAAAALALNTYINAVNLRLVFAFVLAVLEHRPVGTAAGEELLPLEIGFGLILMSFWRALHSFITPRV